MFQMLEETEEALALIAIFVNQNIVSQVEVASAGHSSERKAENMFIYSAKYPPKNSSLPVYVRNVIFIQGNHFNALVWEGVAIELVYVCFCNFEEAEIMMYLIAWHWQYPLPWTHLELGALNS